MRIRFVIVALISITLSSCDPLGRGKVIYAEDTKDRYVVVREGRGNYELVSNAHDDHRPDLPDLREVHGDLEFIFTTLHGWSNPRIVVEARDQRRYQVVYDPWDSEGMKVVARALGLVVAEEERVISALTIREAPGGHHLQPAADGKQVDVETVCCNRDGTWPLGGVTLDGLARFLERRYRRPVVNLTPVEGRWSILVSAKAGKMWPTGGEMWPLDDTGLELRWEMVNVPVTVVKDQPKEEGE